MNICMFCKCELNISEYSQLLKAESQGKNLSSQLAEAWKVLKTFSRQDQATIQD